MPLHFSDDEVRGLNPAFVEKLDKARGLAGIPFIITEGLASGGSHVANSAHQRGLAADIACRGSVSRMKIVSAALVAGFSRIGVYDAHVHLDTDETLPAGVMWVGKSA